MTPERPRADRLRLLPLLVAALASMLVVVAAPAAAHTDLVGSDPTAGATVRGAPEEVTLRFNEPMDSRLANVALTTPGRDPIRLPVTEGREPSTLVAAVGDRGASGGAWNLAYRVTSADGHPVQGTVSFRVRLPTEKPIEEPTEPATGRPAPEEDAASAADEDVNPLRLVAPAVFGGLLLLLAALLLAVRFARR